ncbi:hypothetical protein EMCRGX_G032019 [Ephydatia muelleri]
MVEEIGERQKELRHLQLKEEVLKREMELLAMLASHACKVQAVKGEDQTLNSLSGEDTVKMVMDFFERYEGKVAGLDQTLNQIMEEMKKLNERIQVLRTNAEKMDPSKKTKATETIRSVHIGLEASMETDVTLLVSYVVTNASWSPAYDVRHQGDEGEDWLNAKMSLSTAQPSLGGAPPTLETHTIRFKTPRYYPRMYRLNPMEDYDRILNSSCYSPTCYEPEQFKAVSKLKDKSEEESLKVETLR